LWRRWNKSDNEQKGDVLMSPFPYTFPFEFDPSLYPDLSKGGFKEYIDMDDGGFQEPMNLSEGGFREYADLTEGGFYVIPE